MHEIATHMEFAEPLTPSEKAIVWWNTVRVGDAPGDLGAVPVYLYKLFAGV